MGSIFAIEADLWHDGDGLVRYAFEMRTANFSGRALAWGNETDHLEFAAALAGFPHTSKAELRYSFGTPGTGTCQLHFHCLDGLGHVGLWCALESEYPSGRSEQYEQASLFMQCDPASIDTFVAELRRFAAGTANRAALSGLGP